MKTAIPRRKRPKMASKKRRASLRAKISKLTPGSSELLRYAEIHPTPASFWTGDDDPRQAK